jgi:hypothetical protein
MSVYLSEEIGIHRKCVNLLTQCVDIYTIYSHHMKYSHSLRSVLIYSHSVLIQVTPCTTFIYDKGHMVYMHISIPVVYIVLNVVLTTCVDYTCMKVNWV